MLVVVGEGSVVFNTGSICQYHIIRKSLSGKEIDEYALNKIR